MVQISRQLILERRKRINVVSLPPKRFRPYCKHSHNFSLGFFLFYLLRNSTEHLTASYPGSARNSAAGSLASSRESSASQDPAPYRVLMLGAPAVGKSSLVSQFMTSEYLHAYDTSIGEYNLFFSIDLLSKFHREIIVVQIV